LDVRLFDFGILTRIWPIQLKDFWENGDSHHFGMTETVKIPELPMKNEKGQLKTGLLSPILGIAKVLKGKK
jgi:hypothetical protein